MEWLAILLALLVSCGDEAQAEKVLPIMDAARSVAFEHDHPELLRQIYLRDSALLRHDTALMESYRHRGIDIERLRMKILELDIVENGPRRREVQVIDRLAESLVRLPGGTTRELPRDQPTRRLIELVLTADGWRIGASRLRP